MIDESQLREQSSQIEAILEEVHGLVAPTAWSRIEEVLRRVVTLYGAGLAHALAHARTATTTPASFDQLVCEDELLASLLVVHGLHPRSTIDRIGDVLAAARDALALGDTTLELAAITDDGVADIRACGPLDASIGNQVCRAIAMAAPELAGVHITGAAS